MNSNRSGNLNEVIHQAMWDTATRVPELNQFKPDYNTEAVLVEEMQRMAKRIEDLEATLTAQTARIVDLQAHIENLEGEE